MDLERMYASADFCIVPFGDSFSSRRFFDALRMVGCRGLHSFQFQLNLSSSVPRITLFTS